MNVECNHAVECILNMLLSSVLLKQLNVASVVAQFIDEFGNILHISGMTTCC